LTLLWNFNILIRLASQNFQVYQRMIIYKRKRTRTSMYWDQTKFILKNGLSMLYEHDNLHSFWKSISHVATTILIKWRRKAATIISLGQSTNYAKGAPPTQFRQFFWFCWVNKGRKRVDFQNIEFLIFLNIPKTRLIFNFFPKSNLEEII